MIFSMLYSWGRERYVSETKLTQGMQSFGSMRGVSGHVHNPFAGTALHPPITLPYSCYLSFLIQQAQIVIHL